MTTTTHRPVSLRRFIAITAGAAISVAASVVSIAYGWWAPYAVLAVFAAIGLAEDYSRRLT